MAVDVICNCGYLSRRTNYKYAQISSFKWTLKFAIIAVVKRDVCINNGEFTQLSELNAKLCGN
jgi:hypothetical protein